MPRPVLASLRNTTGSRYRGRRSKIYEPQLHPVPATKVIGHQGSCQMHKISALSLERAAERLGGRTKGDAVYRNPIARNRTNPHVAVAKLGAIGKPVCGQDEDRFGISCAIRASLCDRGDESWRGAASGKHRVDQKGIIHTRGGNGQSEPCIEKALKRVEPIGREGNTRSHRMAAALNEDPCFNCGPYNTPKIGAGN